MTINQQDKSWAMAELVAEEKVLAEADEKLSEARVKYEMAARRYAAVRDATIEMMGGENPYKHPVGVYPADNPAFGRYRYLYRSVGDAALEALSMTRKPLSLDELVKTLCGGHLDTNARAVNASLLNLKGVEKLPDGTYQIAQ